MLVRVSRRSNAVFQKSPFVVDETCISYGHLQRYITYGKKFIDILYISFFFFCLSCDFVCVVLQCVRMFFLPGWPLIFPLFFLSPPPIYVVYLRSQLREHKHIVYREISPHGRRLQCRPVTGNSSLLYSYVPSLSLTLSANSSLVPCRRAARKKNKQSTIGGGRRKVRIECYSLSCSRPSSPIRTSSYRRPCDQTKRASLVNY